jgi:multiple RNA-binding domain-containing protein 1
VLIAIQGTKDAPPPRPNKRRKLDPSPRDTVPSTTVPSDVKTKSKLKKSQRDTEEKADGQLDEFMQVMKPRTKKGPSWANEGGVVASAAVPTAEVNGKEDGEEETRKDEGISDLDWMKMHLKGSLEEKVFEQDEEPEPPSQVAEGNDDQDPATTTILQTSRLFLRNLTFTCTEDDLMELFKPFGEVSQVR